MINITKIDFTKQDGLIPAVIQDARNLQILMVGFMNFDALAESIATKRVVFWSRSKNRLWQKGETSGNYLEIQEIFTDCDSDALVIKAIPMGATCHLGNNSCFNEPEPTKFIQVNILQQLMNIIKNRHDNPQDSSYTSKLLQQGTKRIAQKVGEEGLECALAAVAGDNHELANEAADLIYHLFVLLQDKGCEFKAITDILESRHKK